MKAQRNGGSTSHKQSEYLVFAESILHSGIEVVAAHSRHQLTRHELAHKLAHILDGVLAAEVVHHTVDNAHQRGHTLEAEGSRELAVPRGLRVAGAEAELLDLLLETLPDGLDVHARVAELGVRVDQEGLGVAVRNNHFVVDPVFNLF